MMFYECPAIQPDPLDHFFDQLLPRRLCDPVDMDWRIRKIKEFIDNRAGEVGRDSDDFCRLLELSMSGRQARRLFKAATGLAITEYAKEKRLAIAAEQLRITNIPVKTIAADAGYQSTRNFARRFKKLFLVRPSEFRVVWRKSSTQ